MQPVVLPILEANMTHGTVRAWRKQEGEPVAAGEVLFEVETDKVNAEVEAETSGVLRCIVAPAGTRVPVLGVLAFIGGADESVPAPETWSRMLPPEAGRQAPSPEQIDSSSSLLKGASDTLRRAQVEREGAGKSGTGSAHADLVEASGEVFRQPAGARVPASPAARRLARERGLSLEGIRATGPQGEITRADVQAALSSGRVGAGAGEVDPEFLALLRRDPDAFRGLSSEMKVHLYRRHGAEIGEQVLIEPGAIIVAQEIAIGAASVIGANSTLECDRLRLGRLASLGKRTRIRCRLVEIGDALWSKDDVMIGGGGSGEPGAQLRAGSACFFGEGAYLNAGQPVTLGDEVCIGSRAMLFTHSHWQSVLRGYRSTFGPVEVGDHVFIGNNAFVFPGVCIGAGATVMVNSFVAVRVAPDTFVGGVPAQVVRHITKPTRAQQVALIRECLPDLAAALRDRGHETTRREDGGDVVLDAGRVAVCFAPSWRAALAQSERRTVVLTFADVDTVETARQVTVFDLAASRVFGPQDALSDQIREFCRRRGIRFRPFAWRYGVGHFEGEMFVGRAVGP